jgi:hypothetical protein
MNDGSDFWFMGMISGIFTGIQVVLSATVSIYFLLSSFFTILISMILGMIMEVLKE